MVSREKIIERLQTEEFLITELFSSLSPDELNLVIYFDKIEWRVRDILAHFISAERSFLQLFNNIRENNLGTPVDFSIDQFNNSQVNSMEKIQIKELVQFFKETRTSTINWLKIVPEEELNKIGKHPSMGEVKLIEMVKMINLHNQMHLRDIKNLINEHLDRIS